MSQRKLLAISAFDIKNSDESDTVLSGLYGVSRKTIYNVKNNLRYTNVGPKSLKAYPGIRIFKDGYVINKKNVVLATSPALTLRVKQRNGKKVKIQVSSLISKAFG
jgi:hypothetical protein